MEKSTWVRQKFEFELGSKRAKKTLAYRIIFGAPKTTCHDKWFSGNFPEKNRKFWKIKKCSESLKICFRPKKNFSPSGQNVPWDLVSAAPITSQRLSPHPEGQKKIFLSQIYFRSFWTVFENLAFFCHFCGKFSAKSFYFGVWRRRKNYASLV